MLKQIFLESDDCFTPICQLLGYKLLAFLSPLETVLLESSFIEFKMRALLAWSLQEMQLFKDISRSAWTFCVAVNESPVPRVLLRKRYPTDCPYTGSSPSAWSLGCPVQFPLFFQIHFFYVQAFILGTFWRYIEVGSHQTCLASETNIIG